MASQLTKTQQEFQDVLAECRSLFEKKLHDYGASWRILRPSSLTDQLFIKAKRIRSLEITGESLVGEGIRPEFIALINYSIVGLIQLEKGFVDSVDMTPDEALALYDSYAKESYELMIKKNHDYGASWRILRPSSLTDQLFIKAKRIRSLEITGESLVGEGIRPEFIALINYSIVGLIQLEKGFVDSVDMTPDEALALYDSYAKESYELMIKKNHDYGEAWRDMRVSSYTDLILTKIERIKEIEDLGGATLVSEGIDANYMDIMNYAVFGAIKLHE